ncbi:MAG: hypothetical protein AB8G05_16950 [Oligoflexales bacterium]
MYLVKAKLSPGSESYPNSQKISYSTPIEDLMAPPSEIGVLSKEGDEIDAFFGITFYNISGRNP